MEIDAAEVTSGKTIYTEFCIIGGGPAGLAVAAELCRLGHEVTLLESGWPATAAATSNAAAQELNDGLSVGESYAGLRATRHRGVGGTTLQWNTPVSGSVGAKYLPLDEWDFEGRWEEAADGWPFSSAELIPWIRRAEHAAGIASFADEKQLGTIDGVPCAEFADSGVERRIYQLGSREALIEPLCAQIAGASNARLFVNATVIDIAERDGEATVHVVTDGQKPWAVRARRLILAAGAVENARLLMVSASRRGWTGDGSAWLGRGFMEHPRDRSIVLTPKNTRQYEALSFFDSRLVTIGTAQTTVLGRLGLTRSAVIDGNLLNASATLLANVQPMRERVREVLMRRTGVHGFRHWLPASGHGWSSHPAPSRVFDGFTVLLNIEQPPRRENSITLSGQLDRYGVPLPSLRWQWHSDDQSRLRRISALFTAALLKADAGNVTVTKPGHPDPNAHHHSGTTRMHHDARHGVVNADGRVHGTTSMFVVGASTFPTAGFANPTLTIVAMAFRLADHLHRTN